PALLVGAEADRLGRVGALRDPGELEVPGGAVDLRDVQLVELALEVGQPRLFGRRGVGRVAAEEGGAVGGREVRGHGCGRPAVDVEGGFVAGAEREQVPLGRGDLRSRLRAVLAGRVLDLDERLAVLEAGDDADGAFAAAEDHRRRVGVGRLDPRRPARLY